MLRIVDRYLLREILPPFLLALLVFTFILEIPPIMRSAEALIAKGVPWTTVFRILLTLIPQALGVTIPMALLVGLLIGLGRLSGDREMVALQACGVSLYRLLRPVAVLAVAACAATLYVMVVAIPDANQTFREITYALVKAHVENDIRPRTFFDTFPNRVLYVSDVPASGGWKDVFLADTSQADQPQVFLARRGRLLLDPARRRVEVLLEEGELHKVNVRQPGAYDVQRFASLVISLDPETVFPREGPQRGDAELSVAELRRQADLLRRQGQSPHGPIMRIHTKYAIPVACLVFALISLPLGVTSRKDGKLASFVLGTAVIFGYYVIMYLGEGIAKGRLIDPALAMWLPNILLGIAAAALFLWRAGSVERRIAIPLPSRLPFRRRSTASSMPVPAGAAAAPHGKRVVVVIRVPQVALPRPMLLDGYVASVYLRIMALAAVGMLGIFYISSFIDLSDKMFKGQASGAMILQYLWYATPQFVYYVLPIAALVATLVTIGILTRTSELIVMKACGISLYRAAAPLLMLSLVWSGALFALEESILAHANRRAEALRARIRFGTARTFDVLDRKWLIGRGGEVYHYLHYEPRQRELHGLSVFELDAARWRIARRTYATRAAYRGGWLAQDGWTRAFDVPGRGVRDVRVGRLEAFQRRSVVLEPPDYFVTEQPDALRMTYLELQNHIRLLDASGFSTTELLVDLHRKLAFPLVVIVMTMLGVPFAVTTGRSGALYGIGAGLALALTYWTLSSVFAAIGSAGMLAPVLAAWAPNVLFGGCAAYLLLTVRT